MKVEHTIDHPSDTVCSGCVNEPKRVARLELRQIAREKREQIEALEAEIALLDKAYDLL